MERHGFIPYPPTRYNPDGLPIGISKTPVAVTVKGWPAGDYAGMTCAACHLTELRYQGKRIRIDGGASQSIDMQGFNGALDAALQTVLTDAAKFDRLANRLKISGQEARDNLRKRVEAEAARVHAYDTRTIA